MGTRAESGARGFGAGWAVLCAILLVWVLSPPRAFAQSNGGVTLNSDETLFDVMAALNAAGYDTGLFVDTGDDTRQEVRQWIAQKHLPVVAQIAKFYAAHRIADPGKDFGQYVSLALLLGKPPDFSFTVPSEDLPPDASEVRGLVPLLRTFYRQADLEYLYLRLGPRYLDASRQYSSTVRRQIALTDGYLRFPSGSYLGRFYHIDVCLLGAPGQAQARIYGENYYLVVTPSTQAPFEDIRYQYLHFLLDPLAVKYAAVIHQKAELQAVARQAPALRSDFKNDFSFLVTECLIRAVELRMDKPADAEKQAASDLADGLILTPYFYDALAAYQQQDTPISDYFQQMIQGIDLNKMEKTLASVKFAPPKTSRPVVYTPQISVKDHLLNQGDNLIYLQKYAQARSTFEEVLKQYDPRSERALYGMAVVASNTGEPDIAEGYFKQVLGLARDPRIITWSHIYLGRIYDLEGKRSEALKQYRAASLTAAKFPEALVALQKGLRRPFGSDQKQ